MFSFDYVKDFDPEVAKAMEDELGRQRNNLELIASENLVSEAVMAAMEATLQINTQKDIQENVIMVDVSM